MFTTLADAHRLWLDQMVLFRGRPSLLGPKPSLASIDRVKPCLPVHQCTSFRALVTGAVIACLQICLFHQTETPGGQAFTPSTVMAA